jgi:DNA-directed RNA polymerase subunit RPC12/RpoP
MANMYPCLVCGKSFPRPQDILRHQAAVTLRHYFAYSKTNECKIECPHCGLWVAEPGHLMIHENNHFCRRRRAGTEPDIPIIEPKKLEVHAHQVGFSPETENSHILPYPETDDLEDDLAHDDTNLKISTEVSGGSLATPRRTSPRITASTSSSSASSTPATKASPRSAPSTAARSSHVAEHVSSASKAVASSSNSGVSMKRSLTIEELNDLRGNSKRTRALYVEGIVTIVCTAL